MMASHFTKKTLFILNTSTNKYLPVKFPEMQMQGIASLCFCFAKHQYLYKLYPHFKRFYSQSNQHSHQGPDIHLIHKLLCHKCLQSFISTGPRAFGTEQGTQYSDNKNGLKDQEANNLHQHVSAFEGKCDTEDEVLYQGHIPVLVKESLLALSPKENQLIVDMTFGGGGHAKHIMKSVANLKYIAADRDPLAHKKAVDFSSTFRDGQVVPLLSKFSELSSQLLESGVVPGTVDAFFMDLGASSMQFDSAERGFSLSQDGPLDMRMDGNRFSDSPTAADVVNSLHPGDLGEIIKKYGEESHAVKIAHAIVEARYAFGNFSRTSQLADVIKAVFDSSFRHDRLHRHAHVATKTFQALRIFINDELNEIHNGLEVARHFLKPGGRCVAISFHSLEDRIVKRHFHEIDMDEKPNMSARHHLRDATVSYKVEDIKENYLSGPWTPVSRKVTEATEEEVARNPRARSAKLRAAIKK